MTTAATLRTIADLIDGGLPEPVHVDFVSGGTRVLVSTVDDLDRWAEATGADRVRAPRVSAGGDFYTADAGTFTLTAWRPHVCGEATS